MLDLGLLGFTSPWLLLALTALPVLWLLLRVTPPAPRRMRITNLFLKELVGAERTPARTPWWLLLLRMALAALLILALAGPLLNPAPRLGGSGPLLLVVDDGWASAKGWDQRVTVARELLQQAEREGREVLLLDTAAPPEGISGGMALQRLTARAALEALPGWQPRPWPVDRAAARAVLERAPDLGNATVVWLSDGLANSAEDQSAAERLGETLRRFGPVQVHADPVADQPLVLHLGEPGAVQLEARLVAVPAPTAREAEIVALGPTGESLARVPVTVQPGEASAAAVLDVPADLRNRIARVELTPPQGIAGVFLLDERWRRRTVGLVGPARSSGDQPLLSELYFIDRALARSPRSTKGRYRSCCSAALAAGHGGHRPSRARTGARLDAWMEAGGVLLRFAGPRLAAAADDLVPARLRPATGAGRRLSWSEPLALAPFPPDSPFAGLAVSGDARVSRQVLAEPGPDLAAATLASLADGTPLVTGARRGKGWLILVHTTANTAWTVAAALGPVRADAASACWRWAPASAAGAPAARGRPGAGCVRPPRGSHRAPCRPWRPRPSRTADARARSTRPASMRRSACARLATHRPRPPARRSTCNGRCRTRCRSAPRSPAAHPSPTPALRSAIWRRYWSSWPCCWHWPTSSSRWPARPAPARRLATRGRCLVLVALPVAAQDAGPDDAQIVELTRETRLAYVVTGNAESTRRARRACAG